MKQTRLKFYIPPSILVEEINLEESIANGSLQINPGNEAGVIVIDSWEEGSDLESPLENSRW